MTTRAIIVSGQTSASKANKVIVTVFTCAEGAPGGGHRRRPGFLPGYKVLVFFTTARLTQCMAELFNLMGVPVLEIHSRKSQGHRSAVSEKFRVGVAAHRLTRTCPCYPGTLWSFVPVVTLNPDMTRPSPTENQRCSATEYPRLRFQRSPILRHLGSHL